MKKLFIETYGCQMNVADSEVVASVMQMAGYEICEKEEEADAIFLNTCSIRENAENKIYHRLDTLHAEQKKGRKVILGVLGCMAERVKDDLYSEPLCQSRLRTRQLSQPAGYDCAVRDGNQRHQHRTL